jgi:thiosulfate dehydrogenase [quinone] large subunit
MDMNRPQVTALVTLRLLVGWHFLYEGLAKLANPYWTSAEYLDQAGWLFKHQFSALAASPTAVSVVDFLNEWGLALIGLGLLLGLFTRAAAIAGIALLLLYYIVAPPLPGIVSALPREGSYLIVNKVLIEAAALAVLLVFPAKRFGLDGLLFRRRSVVPSSQHEPALARAES